MTRTLPPRWPLADEFPLWPAPDPLVSENQECWFELPGEEAPLLRNVTHPTLTAFVPSAEASTGTAVVICPGGAHHLLSMINEGADVASWLKARGIAAFVLKYRLLPTSADHGNFLAHLQSELSKPDVLHELATRHAATVLADAQRALTLIRTDAARWHVRADKIGILGFSAGGHMAGLVAVHHDERSRPDFVASIYGAHWNELQMPKDPMPLFVTFANDDPLGEVITGGNTQLSQQWRAAETAVELHAYARGGHGFGMRRQNLPSDGWIDRFHEWLLNAVITSP